MDTHHYYDSNAAEKPGRGRSATCGPSGWRRSCRNIKPT